VTWKLSDWHIIRRFLQLDDLLVNELTLFVNDKVWV